MKFSRSGFTLIELIIVVAIIAIIAAAVFVAIDPARRLHAARNSTRWADVTAILEGVKKYQADNDGDLPSTSVGIDGDYSTYQLIGGTPGSCDACGSLTMTGSVTNCIITGLATDLRPYLTSIPIDPKTGDSDDSRYYINKDQYGIISVGSCDEEGEGGGGVGDVPTVEVTR